MHQTGLSIDGRRVDVVSRGELIESGTAVRVLEVRGNRVVVVRDRNDSPSAAEPDTPAPADAPRTHDS